jgi:phosphoglycolate phosphatase/pyrophosphatase PpaX
MIARHPSPNAPLHGLIWDVDGTLSDTLDLCADAIATAIERHGGPRLTRGEVTALFGPTEEGILKSVLGPEVGAAASETYLDLYARGHDSGRSFTGVTDLVADCAATGIPMGIVTGKGARSAAITISALGLDGVFDPVVAGSEAGSIKTEAILSVVRAWDVSPDSVAYVGDAVSDVHHARAAGVRVVSVAWKPDAELDALEGAAPDVVAPDVPALRAWLAQRMTGDLR